MYGISDEYTMCMMDLAKWAKNKYGQTELKTFLPRMLWMKKSWTMQEAHRFVFKRIRHVLSEWADWADPASTKAPKKEGVRNLKDHIIEFPYRM